MNRRRALGCCLSMIFSENRSTLFRIMLWRAAHNDRQDTARFTASCMQNEVSELQAAGRQIPQQYRVVGIQRQQRVISSQATRLSSLRQLDLILDVRRVDAGELAQVELVYALDKGDDRVLNASSGLW